MVHSYVAQVAALNSEVSEMKAELADLAAALGGGVFTDPGAAAAEVAAQLDHAEERLATLRVRSIVQRTHYAKDACVEEVLWKRRLRFGVG